MKRYFLAALALLTVGAVAVFAGQAQSASAKPAAGKLVGTGATFPFPLISKWIPAVGSALGIDITYSATGSGAGIAQITARTVDFGASDAPLSPDQLTACKGCVVIPWALAGMSVPYNIPGLNARLRLNGAVHRQHLPRQHHQLERRGDQGTEPECEPPRPEDHAGLPVGRLGLDLRVHRLPLGGQPAVEEQGRQEHERQLPGGHGRTR